MPVIPKKLHAIWLGSVLEDEGRKNISAWKNINNDYEMNLWIDSSLYNREDKEELENLIKWAQINNIVLNDIAPNSMMNELIINRSDIYQGMLSKRYYDDEINGADKNLAAASDILRVEILTKEGGVYFDAKDVFPDEKLDEINSEHGFLANIERRGTNNDLMASIPNGKFITTYRQQIYENYNDLYTDSRALKSHRNPDFSFPGPYAGEKANPRSRKESTLIVTGPGALNMVLDKISEQMYFDDQEIKFNPKKYEGYEQASSWYDTKMNTRHEKIVPILRNYVREHFNSTINNRTYALTTAFNFADPVMKFRITSKYKSLLTSYQ